MASLIIKFFFFLIFYSACVCAGLKYPADVSYMVADFKYSQEHGLKICEVQHGSLSAVGGDLYISGGNGKISPMVASFFDRFSSQKWIIGPFYPPLAIALVSKGWQFEKSIKSLTQNPAFLSYAKIPPNDPSSIASYAGIVYASHDLAPDIDLYQKAYPGILFIDAATFPYWIDKYKMNELFNQNVELKQYKAEWEIYPKKYDPLLAERIQERMPSELYVIKPRKEFLGNGVIVIPRQDLDGVLQMILEPEASLKTHPDKRVSYWGRNKNDIFLIEKYYRSDFLQLSHKVSENPDALVLEKGGDYHYDASMRIVFLLEYDNGKMTYHGLGGFWKLPYKALEEEGTLNERTISFCKPPFYRAIDPELFEHVNRQLERAMLLLYEIMLQEPLK